MVSSPSPAGDKRPTGSTCAECGHVAGVHRTEDTRGACRFDGCGCLRTTEAVNLLAQPCVNAPAGDANHRKRPTTLLGPRLGWWCASCRKARGRSGKARTKASTRERVYGLTADDTAALVGTLPLNRRGVPVCPVCLRATGARKALAVDHDHQLEAQGKPMRDTVRGLLCGPCNQMEGRFDNEALQQMIDYRNNPPAWSVLHTNGR